MNRQILRLAIPNIISNITIPILGMADTAIAGRLGGESTIGAIAIGTAIFGFIYWNCAFIRMGTSGMTAQAYGAGDFRETGNLLIRSLAVSLGIALLLLIFRHHLGNFTIWAMKAGGDIKEDVARYFFVRIWAAPATVSLYSIHGWFIGMQNAKLPMLVAILQNIVNVSASIVLVFPMGMGIAGVALGTVISQYFGLGLSCLLWFMRYREIRALIDLKAALRTKPMLRFFDVNKDIFLRTALNVLVYTFFTRSSAATGDLLILATNSILIQLFTFFSYMSDGFAYAAEAITGRFTGARDFFRLRKAIKYMFFWSLGIALLFVGVYIIFGSRIVGIFTDSAEIISTARHYLGWVIIVPLIGFAPFLMDGILIGATRTRILRNSMFIAAAAFFCVYYIFIPSLGNNALWLAFVVFLVVRGVSQYTLSDRLKILYRVEGGRPTGI
ncbi:MAG: MATE family efflux transporter [Rikenellaceae bacterium]|nr:MATE family efflux transporter [Rikenellaceae bacterium]